MSLKSTPVRHPSPGCIVEFMHGNKPQLAWVLEEQSGKLRLLGMNKREMKLPAQRVLPWTGPQYAPEATRQEMFDTLVAHQNKREELERSLDPMELWDLAQGEVDKASVEWFAELLWDADSVRNTENLAALGHALLYCKSHFKFHPPDFEIYTEEKVELRLIAQEAERERERLVSAGHQFFQALWAKHTNPQKSLPTLNEDDLEQKLKELLLKRIAEPHDSETQAVWAVVAKGLPDGPHTPMLLAQAWGLLPTHYNFLLDQAGYDAGDAWSQAYAEEIRAQQEACQSPGEIEPFPFISIDSETTRDIDDAFFVEPTPEGGYTLRLALACPSLFWNFESPLAKKVASRASSVYLPEGDSHMLPEALGTDLYSLIQGQTRPALMLTFHLDANGTLNSCVPSLTWAKIVGNLSYARVEPVLEASDSPDSPSPEDITKHESNLRCSFELAQKLRTNRINDGAVIILRPEPELQLEGQDKDTRVGIQEKPDCPKSMLLVSEFMILANSGIAKWAQEQDVPLYYRTQAINIPKDNAGEWSAPEEIYRVVKILGSASMETKPRKHASLGVDAYAPISSPLRRYPDFINLTQIQSYLQAGHSKWTKQELKENLPGLNARLDAVQRCQRFRPRYWKLLYFKQNAKQRFNAIAVEETQYYVQLALPREQLFVRGPKKLFGDKVYAGQRFSLRLGKIDPLNNDIAVLEAWEE